MRAPRMAMAILLVPNRWPRSNVLLRLSRLSSGLAAAAVLGALFGPDANRALCRDAAVVLAVAAFGLWRLALALQRRRARPDDAVPEPLPVDRAAWLDAVALLERRIAAAPSFDAALLAASDALRGELGAASARALVVQSTDTRHAVCEVVAAERPWRAPPVDVRDDGSALALALAGQRPALDWPQAVALPVLREARVVAVIELRRFGFELDEPSLRAMLERCAAVLGARPDAPATGRADTRRREPHDGRHVRRGDARASAGMRVARGPHGAPLEIAC